MLLGQGGMMKSRNHKSERKNIYLTAFIFIILILLLWIFIPSFFLQLERISLIGNSHFSEEDVLTHLSHLLGKSLSRLSTRELSSSLSKISWIERFEAYKIPPHTLLLRIKERTPFLLVYYNEKISLLVDDEGYLLEKSPAEYTLPILYVSKIKMEKHNKLPSKVMSPIKEILNELKDTPISVERIHLSKDGDIQITTKNGLKIILGKPEELYKKLYLLKMFWGRIPNIETRLLYIDLSCLQAPVIMKREANK
jgi:cell division protein FtsQ